VDAGDGRHPRVIAAALAASHRLPRWDDAVEILHITRHRMGSPEIPCVAVKKLLLERAYNPRTRVLNRKFSV
jgi:hypothetical protein